VWNGVQGKANTAVAPAPSNGLNPGDAPLFAGIERADSIAFDPHKWMYTPHSGGCVLVRDMQRLADSFSSEASYIYQDAERTGEPVMFGMLGPQLSRGFQALKVWVSLLAHGRRAYAARISHDAELARYLALRVQQRPEFELCAPVPLSICCFRYVPPGLPEGLDGHSREGYLDTLNQRLMTEVQLDGRVFISNAVARNPRGRSGSLARSSSPGCRASAPGRSSTR
jgi:glutamate/tyrosine decarboxylase-like PLP-dependent enzyme